MSNSISFCRNYGKNVVYTYQKLRGITTSIIVTARIDLGEFIQGATRKVTETEVTELARTQWIRIATIFV